ncbi:MAG: hypothetical protein GTO18_15785 [Anaerolineales bacterium]|nr:hypothetical protein [Anaerolineales bacterium]
MSEGIETTKQSAGDTFANAVVRILRFLLRLTFVLLLGIGLGLLAFYGIPALYRDFIQPVQSNSRQIRALEDEILQVQEEMKGNESEYAAALAEIEGEIAQQNETIAEIQVEIEMLNLAVEDLGQEVALLVSLSDKVETVIAGQSDFQDQLAELESTLEDQGIPIEELNHRIELLRAMDLITRARLLLISDNIAKAKEDIAIAEEILSVASEGLGEETESLTIIVERLNQILVDIVERPIIASDELEVVWHLLVIELEPQSELTE